MISKKEALEILYKDKKYNCNLIYYLENYYDGIKIEKVNDSLFIKSIDYGDIAIALNDKKDLELILNKTNNDDKHFFFIDDFTMEEILKIRELDWKLDCKQYILEDYSHLEEGKHTTTSLTVEDAETLYNNSIYQETLEIDYLKERIRDGFTSAIRDNGELVAWAFTHDDNAIGGLHVLDEYRKKGYGYSVTYSIIKQVIDKYGIAYVQVQHGNDKSLNLVDKLGFEYNRNINFIKVK